jgi:hypothetical protein
MNWKIAGFKSVEAALIGIMSLCAALAFVSSRISPEVPYILLIVWGALFVTGSLTISVFGKGGGVFTWLVVVSSLPSLLSFDSLDWPGLIRLDLINRLFQTDLSYYQALGLGVTGITCYLLINFMGVLKQSRRNLVRQGADPPAANSIYTRSHGVLLIFMGISLAATALILALVRGVESFSLFRLKDWSSSLFLVGLGCTLVMAVYLYWLVSRRKHIS